LNTDGSIFHIDFGFFLSNLPGKGYKIEKNVPFKLTSDWIELLGGINSKTFAKYRKMVF